MIRISFLSLLILCSFLYSPAQTTLISSGSGSSGSESLRKITLESLEGTYQFQMVNNRYKPAIPVDLAQQIEDNRKDDVDVFLKISGYFRIHILSRNHINRADFEPIEQNIVWIKE